MAFDGIFCHKMVGELVSAVDCHIDKIYQPSSDELVFLLRKKGFVKRLLMSVRSGMSRVQFTEAKPENPQTPPMFCQLARKYFSGARFESVSQVGLDRIVKFSYESFNELGDRISLKVVCELMGNTSNVILVNEKGRIIDALHRSNIEIGKRLIQPGAVYEYPAKSNKLNLLSDSFSDVKARIEQNGEIPLWAALTECLDGFSPLISRELAYGAFGEDRITGEIGDFGKLKDALLEMKNAVCGTDTPIMLKDKNGVPKDFSIMPIRQYGTLYECVQYESFSALLDNFYEKRESEARRARLCSELKRTITNLISRAQRRQAIRIEELKKSESREMSRIYGELIKANIHAIKAGSSSCTVCNFYDEELKNIEIPLNPALSPQANASCYFKEYKKLCVASQTLTGLISDDKNEITYLESVLESLSRCEKLGDIAQIKEELIAEGYMRQSGRGKRTAVSNTFLEFTSKEGYRIIVGKNNIQNDYITTKLASKGDMWFHVKGSPGSHVVVFCGGEDLSDETLLFAATLAAKNSKACNSSNVPVDYTPIKYVKKPSGAKAGMVIYTTNKTLFVTSRQDDDK